MSKYTRAIKLAKDYIKHPYIPLDNNIYSEFSHQHICFPYRLIGDDFKKVCPHYKTKGLEPEHSDCCDLCKYFGIINFTVDNNEKNISFVMDKSIVETFEGD